MPIQGISGPFAFQGFPTVGIVVPKVGGHS